MIVPVVRDLSSSVRYSHTETGISFWYNRLKERPVIIRNPVSKVAVIPFYTFVIDFP